MAERNTSLKKSRSTTAIHYDDIASESSLQRALKKDLDTPRSLDIELIECSKKLVNFNFY